MTTLWMAVVALLAAGPAQPTGMQGLEFLAGCWQGPFADGKGTMEEFYTSPSQNIILGTTRYLKQGAAVQYEFTLIQKKEDGIWMTPYPGGRPSADPFRLTTLTPGEAIFEAPGHDYPKRIIYRVAEGGGRTARIDGGPEDPGGQQWDLKPVSCPGGGTKIP